MINNSTNAIDDALFVKAYQELESEHPHIATWAKALAESGGNKAQAKSMYLQLRVEVLKAETTATPATQITKYIPTEKRKLNQKWLAAVLITLPLIAAGIYFASSNTNIPNEARQVVDGYEILPSEDEVLDPNTKLIWKRCSVGQTWDAEQNTCTGISDKYSFKDAQLVAEELNQTGHAEGQPVWRVPTIQELATIRYCTNGFKGEQNMPDGQSSMPEQCAGESFQQPTISHTAFPATAEGRYWSSTVGDVLMSWGVRFNKGDTYVTNAEERNHVRLVRNSTTVERATQQPASVQATVEATAPVNTETLEPSNVGETSLPEDSQPLELVTIKNKPLCVGGNQNCNFRHGETMECMRLFMAADYSAPTQHFCKKAAFYDNNPDIYYALARLYQNGVFGSEQRKLAAEWYEKAANLGHAASQNNLGVMYYYGDAVEKNTDLAMAWLEKAAAQGLEDAKKSVEKLKSRVSHTQPPAHAESQQADSPDTLGQVHGLNPQGDGYLAVRAKPDASAAEIAKLYEGDKVLVLQESNDWVYLKLQNKNTRGWSHKKWIQVGLLNANKTSVGQRFIAQKNTVKDTQTGLIWQRCSVGQTWDGNTCSGEAKKFNLERAKNLSSNSWRLPTIRELVSLRECSAGVDITNIKDFKDGNSKVAQKCIENSKSPTINAVFSNTKDNAYWSATTNADELGTSWYMSFRFGGVGFDDRKGMSHVRLVRDNNISATSTKTDDWPHDLPAKMEESSGWRAQIKVDCLDIGKTCGKIDFRGLNCGGELIYKGNTDAEYEFDENLNYGNCVKGCKIILDVNNNTYTEYCSGGKPEGGNLSLIGN